MGLRRDIQLLDVKIATERLILRPIALVDLKPIARELTDDITRYMYPPAARSRMDVAPFIADSLEGLGNNTNLQLAAVLREKPDKLLGASDFISRKQAHQNSVFGLPRTSTDKAWD